MRINCLVSIRLGSVMQYQVSYRKLCVVYFEELFVYFCQVEIKLCFVILLDLIFVMILGLFIVSNIWVIYCELFSLLFCIVMLLILN